MCTQNKLHLALLVFLLLGSATTANALVVDVSLNTTDWEKTNLTFSGTNYQGSATVTNTGVGNLRGTRTTANPGTNYSLGLHSKTAYNFQDATLHYKWLLNGLGTYANIFTGLDTGDGHAHLINNFDPNSPFQPAMTTAWSFAGSEVIPSNAWLWTEVTFSSTGYDFTVSKTGYGGMDFLHGTKAISSTTWDALAAAKPFFQVGDTHVAGQYFEVAELSIITKASPPGPAVPEPAAMLLFGAGLAGLAAAGRRQRMKSFD